MKYLKVGSNDFRDMFSKNTGFKSKLFSEAEGDGVAVEVKENAMGDTKVELTDENGNTIETKVAANDSIDISIPADPNGAPIEKVTVAVETFEEAEKKCLQFTEAEMSAVDAMAAGVGAVIENNEIKVGVVEALPEAKEADKVPDGETTFSDMMGGRISGEITEKIETGGDEDGPATE